VNDVSTRELLIGFPRNDQAGISSIAPGLKMIFRGFNRHQNHKILNYYGQIAELDMIEKVKVPRKVYDELIPLNREVHYTLDFQKIIKMAEDRGYLKAAAWLENHEDDYKRGFARGFEPED